MGKAVIIIIAAVVAIGGGVAVASIGLPDGTGVGKAECTEEGWLDCQVNVELDGYMPEDLRAGATNSDAILWCADLNIMGGFQNINWCREFKNTADFLIERNGWCDDYVNNVVCMASRDLN